MWYLIVLSARVCSLWLWAVSYTHLDVYKRQLQKSINRVLASDGSLRTRIFRDGGRPGQYHAPYAKEIFPVLDFSHTSGQGIKSWEHAVTREVIPLEDGPLYRFVLFRTGENSGGVLIKVHHIISDGWAQVLLCNRIGQTYLDLLSDKEVAVSYTHLDVYKRQVAYSGREE